MNIQISDIQRFCMHDGPGIRTTVFFKGCPLRCQWCHNPETNHRESQLLYTEKLCRKCQACASVCPHGVHAFLGDRHVLNREKCQACGKCADACVYNALEIIGKSMTVQEILTEVRKDSAFYGTQGGLTVSGGEPTFQMNGLLELLKGAKNDHISTLIETCGFFDPAYIPDLCSLVDIFYWDIKDTDDARHRNYTGVSNERILKNLKAVDERLKENQKIRLRCVLVRGVNTDETHYHRLNDVFLSLSHAEGIEFLPYHVFGASKNERLGQGNNAHNEWIPEEKDVFLAEEYILKNGGKICFGKRDNHHITEVI